MTKTERKLLKHLAGSYFFILCLRDDAIRRKDGFYIAQTEGIDLAIAALTETYPEFKRLFNQARKKATAIVEQEKAREAKRATNRKATKESKG